MSSNYIDALNQSSMNIILHAGNARDFYQEALDQAETGSLASCEELLEKANEEIVEAHRLQTRLIQDAIEQEDPDVTVLFIHAQDTVMTVDSELRLVKRLISLYRKIYEREVTL